MNSYFSLFEGAGDCVGTGAATTSWSWSASGASKSDDVDGGSRG